ICPEGSGICPQDRGGGDWGRKLPGGGLFPLWTTLRAQGAEPFSPSSYGTRAMRPRTFAALTGALGLGALLALGPGAYPQAPGGQPADDTGQQQGVEVLGRGPVHEAFAEPDTANPRPNPIVPKKPPDPVEEIPPDQKPEGNNVQWIPGYWAWDDESADFIWVSGLWRDVPPGRQWVPGHWAEVEGGWQWVSGFWGDVQQTEVEYLPPPPTS